MAHLLLRNGALHIVADKKVSQFYSLLLVILYFFVLSGIALFLLDKSGLTVVMLLMVYMFLISNSAHYYNGLKRNECLRGASE